MAEGRFSAINGKNVLSQKWTELKDFLNGMVDSTKSKTVAQWQTVCNYNNYVNNVNFLQNRQQSFIFQTWRDIKSKTSAKARNLRSQKAATGNIKLKIESLTILEQRILGIIGLEYVEGSRDCPDSMPEEEVS